jgi:6-phosphogluconolactonase
VSEVAVVRDAAEVAGVAAELFIEASAGAVAARGRGSVALTGGGSARPVFERVRSPGIRDRIPWGALRFFFTDERAVPPQDERSNYGLTQRELFAHVPVQAAQVHRLRGEAEDLDQEAKRAAADLRATLGEPPRFDLVLLGLGTDGHICSLFAGVPSSADRGDEELVRHVRAPQHLDPRVDRLTLTPFLIVTARNVVLQVTGEQKAAVLARALKGPEDLVACPAQWLRHAAGRVVIAADDAAAAEL